ncbi:hypothetical protein [Allofournierella sp. CML151]|uniref:hypothetical protein n=1 Tax=Allofournierella sp. CML151 TaxID=2998082 RepID=UPI0022EB0963|nr:hypothetical protein [Fournierella sp. CML151]
MSMQIAGHGSPLLWQLIKPAEARRSRPGPQEKYYFAISFYYSTYFALRKAFLQLTKQ